MAPLSPRRRGLNTLVQTADQDRLSSTILPIGRTRWFRDQLILTQVCGNHSMVLKANPPLMDGPEQGTGLLESMARAAEAIHSSKGIWTDGFGLARRVVNI